MIADGINYEEINKTRQERLLKENIVRCHFLEKMEKRYDLTKGSSVLKKTFALRFLTNLASFKEQRVETEKGRMVFKFSRIIYIPGEYPDWDYVDMSDTDSSPLREMQGDYPWPGIVIEAFVGEEKIDVGINQETTYVPPISGEETPEDINRDNIFRHIFLEGMRQIYESTKEPQEGSLVVNVSEYPAKISFRDIIEQE